MTGTLQHPVVTLTDGVLDRDPDDDPGTYWRVGFTVPAVAAGYAYHRDSLVDSVLDRLTADENVVLVGPRGCGKSTTCKQVATRWLETGVGVVDYVGEVQHGHDGRGVVQAHDGGLESVDGAAGGRDDGADRDGGPRLLVVEDALRQDASWLVDLLRWARERPSVVVLVEARRGMLDLLEDDPRWGDEEAHECRRVLDGDRFATVEVPPIDADDVEAIAGFFDDLVGANVDPGSVLPRSAGGTTTVGDEWLHVAHALTADEGYSNALDRSVSEAYEQVHRGDSSALVERVGLAINVWNAARLPVSDALLFSLGDDPAAVEDAVAALSGSVLVGVRSDRAHLPHEIWSALYVRQLLEREAVEDARRRFAEVVNPVLEAASRPADQGAGNSLIGERETGERDLVTPTTGDRRARPPSVASVLTRLGEFGRRWPVLAPLFRTGSGYPLEVPATCAPTTEAAFVRLQGKMHLERGALETAASAFDRAMALVREAEPTEREWEKARVQHRLDCARVAHERGEHEEATRTLEAAREAAASLGYQFGEASALIQLGTIRSKQGEMASAIEAHEASFERFRSLGDDRMCATVLKEMGNLQFRRGAYEAAEDCYQRALDTYRQLGDRRGEASCLSNLGVVATYQDRLEEAIEYQERSLHLREQVGAQAKLAATLNNLGIVERRRGNLESARDYYERSLEIKRRSDDKEGVASSLGNLGLVHREMGDLQTAERYHRRSLELYQEIGADRHRGKCKNNIGQVYLRQGRYEAAQAQFREAYELFEQTDDRVGVGRAEYKLGLAVRERGDREAALSHFRASFETLADAVASEAIEAAVAGIEAATATGQQGLADRLYESAREYACEHGFEEEFETLSAELEAPSDGSAGRSSR